MPEIVATIETLAGLIRVYAPGTSTTGPYATSIAFVVDGTVVTLKGLRMQGFSRGYWIAVGNVLRAAGYTEAIWHRADGRTIRRKI